MSINQLTKEIHIMEETTSKNISTTTNIDHDEQSTSTPFEQTNVLDKQETIQTETLTSDKPVCYISEKNSRY